MDILHQQFEIAHGAVFVLDFVIIDNPLIRVFSRLLEYWHQPDGIGAKLLNVLQFGNQPLNVPVTVRVAVTKCPNIYAVVNCAGKPILTVSHSTPDLEGVSMERL